MKKLLLVAIGGFLVFTSAYFFVYLVRAFRLTLPVEGRVVEVWHGDNFIRALLVAELIAIGLLLLVVLLIADLRERRRTLLSAGATDWLTRQAEQTSESPESIAERAIALYRARIEEGMR